MEKKIVYPILESIEVELAKKDDDAELLRKQNENLRRRILDYVSGKSKLGENQG